MAGFDGSTGAAPVDPLAGPGYLLRAWGTEEGLPENSATAIAQTRDGYLWFGTWSGLVRFNGDRFVVFDPRNTPQLAAAGVVNLHADRRDRLWVSTIAGLVVKDGSQWRVLGPDEGWAGNYVRTFAERQNGDLLITTFDGHVLAVENDRLTGLPPPPGEPGQGYLGAVDENGQWWVAQNRFVGYWDGQRWVPVHAPSPSVPRARVACARARGGGVWVLLGGELLKFRAGGEASPLPLPPIKGGIWSIHEDSRTNLWICSYDFGLFQLAPGGELRRWTDHGLSSLAVRGVFEDREENLWIASNGGGLIQLTPRRFFPVDLETPVLRKLTRSVAWARDGGAYIAVYDAGLFRQDEKGIARVPVPGPDNVSAYGLSVLEDRSGRLWYGDQDACWFRSGQSRFERVPLEPATDANVNALFEDSRGRVWIATREGAVVCEGHEFRQLGPETGLTPGRITGFGEDGTGAIWVAGSQGVFRQEHDQFKAVMAAESQPLKEVLCFKTDVDGAMWMGTRAAGLIRWRNGQIDWIGVEQGLPDCEVRGLVEDDQGFFWMPSNRGILRASRSELGAAADDGAAQWQVQLLDRQDGLPSPECSSSQPNGGRDAAGQLWFATQKGVAAIDPAAFRLNSQPPPVQVEQLTYHVPTTKSEATKRRPLTALARGEVRLETPSLRPVRLPPGTHGLEFEFAALSFRAPEKVQFQYLVEGYARDWSDPGENRTVRFHRLPPGEYVFRVRAANNDGVWNETGASLAFTILPYFWQTAWFRVGMALCLVGSGAALAWHQLHSRVRRALERERAALEIRDLAGRLICAQEDERRRIAHELHDDFSQSLALLSVEMELFGTANPSADPEAAQKLGGMAARVKELSSEVHRMAHQLHPAKLDQLGLVAAARGFCRELSQKAGLQIDFESGDFPRAIPPEFALCLYRVIQESLQNVVRHSDAQSARVALGVDGGQLCLIVADPGRGFDLAQARQAGGLGLSSMRERVRLLQGTLQVTSGPGQGTQIQVCLPWEPPRMGADPRGVTEM